MRAEKGHDGNAEKRHGKLLPWKVIFFKGITAVESFLIKHVK